MRLPSFNINVLSSINPKPYKVLVAVAFRWCLVQLQSLAISCEGANQLQSVVTFAIS